MAKIYVFMYENEEAIELIFAFSKEENKKNDVIEKIAEYILEREGISKEHEDYEDLYQDALETSEDIYYGCKLYVDTNEVYYIKEVDYI